MRLALLAATAALLALPAQAGAASQFARMFPGQPPLNQQSNQQLADLAQAMLDPGDAANDIAGTPSGFTYLGQFADHDLTLDTSPSPTAPVDPTTLSNGRTLAFDLDSVYGAGPQGSPQLYEADGVHLRVQEANPNGVRDLPRNPDGSAVLVEGRNDENEIISQLHVAFLKLHNTLVDSGLSFAAAQRTLRWHWQWVLVHDYLPHVAGQDRVRQTQVPGFESGARTRADLANSARRRGFYNPGQGEPSTPVEFSAAVFRYGHSQVRAAYELNDGLAAIPVFSFTEPDLRGGREIPAGRQIDWNEFFAVDDADDNGRNQSRKFDTLLSASLFQLPIPGAEAAGSNVLGFRNLVRAKFYGLPSYESVAARMGVDPVGPPAFPEGTPLWFGILRESQVREGGERLGPVAGRLVAEVFQDVIAADPGSYVNKSGARFRPTLDAGDDSTFDIQDLLRDAGVVEDE